MKPDASNLKKRKLLVAAVEDFGLPAPKHVCCEAAVRSVCESSSLEALDTEDVEVCETPVQSTQDSNSFLADSQSSEVIFDAGFRTIDFYEEASTSWANSGSITSRNDSFSFESRISSVRRDDMVESQLPYQEDSGWHDVDSLDECFSAHYCKDNKQQTAGELEGFLSSSALNTDLYTLSSERCNADQDTRMGRHKQTIDQEFEQYFSTLMLD